MLDLCCVGQTSIISLFSFENKFRSVRVQLVQPSQVTLKFVDYRVLTLLVLLERIVLGTVATIPSFSVMRTRLVRHLLGSSPEPLGNRESPLAGKRKPRPESRSRSGILGSVRIQFSEAVPFKLRMVTDTHKCPAGEYLVS